MGPYTSSLSTAWLDLSHGIHFEDLAQSSVFGGLADWKAEMQISVSLAGSLKMKLNADDPPQWHFANEKEDLRVCSPGIQFEEELHSSKTWGTRVIGWLNTYVLEWMLGGIQGYAKDFFFCQMKYTLPSLPWFGQMTHFVGSRGTLETSPDIQPLMQLTL